MWMKHGVVKQQLIKIYDHLMQWMSKPQMVGEESEKLRAGDVHTQN